MSKRKPEPEGSGTQPSDAGIANLFRATREELAQRERLVELMTQKIEQLEHDNKTLRIFLDGKELLESFERSRLAREGKKGRKHRKTKIEQRHAALRADWNALEAALGSPKKLEPLLLHHHVPLAKLATFKASNIAKALERTHQLSATQIRAIIKNSQIR